MDSWKNFLIRRFLSWRTTKHPLVVAAEAHRFLVISTTAMGDTLWSTPAFANLRSHYPHAYIAALTSPIGEQILRNNPHIDQLIILKEPVLPWLFSLIVKLRREKFDTALILHTSQRLVLPICSLSGISRIIGTKNLNKGLDDLLTDVVEPQYVHEIERRQKILDYLNVPAAQSTLSYYVEPSERDQARQYIGTSNHPLVAMHLGSKEPFRRWPIRCFAKTAQALQEKFGCEIFITGSPSEKKLLQKFKQIVPQARIVSSSSVRFLGAIIEQMDLVVSNDTGPFHLACALDRPAIGLYVSTDPHICGPHLASKAVTISRNPTCEPCIKRRCRDSFCFLQIAPEEVIDTCSRILKHALS